jgi:general secretion pathway protein G
MIESIRELNKRRSAESESGFTLIELLIVIVVLGILAAIVVFALNGVTGQSTAAACQSDAKTVGIGVAALETENPTVTPATSAAWQTDLTGSTLTGGPFLQSWPSSSNYSISVAIGTEAATADAAIGGVSGTSVHPAAGDVLVTASQNTVATPKVYDATANPDEACLHLKNGS